MPPKRFNPHGGSCYGTCPELSAVLPQAAGVCLENDADDGAGQRVQGQQHGYLEFADEDSG